MHQIQQRGQWPNASKSDAICAPLQALVKAPLLCSILKSEKVPFRGVAGAAGLGQHRGLCLVCDQDSRMIYFLSMKGKQVSVH